MFQLLRMIWHLFIKLNWCFSAFVLAFSISIFLFPSKPIIAVYISIFVSIIVLYKMINSQSQLKHLMTIDQIMFLMFLGHLGSISICVILYFAETGGFSGLFLVPSIVWCAIWYLLALSKIKKYWLHTPNK